MKLARTILLMCTGIVLIVCACKIYEGGERNALVQKNSPVFQMPIVGRQKGLGTVKMPDKIYVWHVGKTYTLSVSNRRFRESAKLESLAVHYDARQDIAVLTNQDVTGPYPLLIAIFLMGIFLALHPVLGVPFDK